MHPPGCWHPLSSTCLQRIWSGPHSTGQNPGHSYSIMILLPEWHLSRLFFLSANIQVLLKINPWPEAYGCPRTVVGWNTRGWLGDASKPFVPFVWPDLLFLGKIWTVKIQPVDLPVTHLCFVQFCFSFCIQK